MQKNPSAAGFAAEGHSFLLEELCVNGRNRPIRVFLVDEHRHLDLTGGDHHNVDVGLIQRLKHRCGHAGVIHHAAHHGDLCHVLIDIHMVIAQSRLIVLDDLVGLIGHALIDFSAGWGVWWSWVIASGVFGLLMGLSAKLLKMDEAEMGKKGLIKFNVAQLVCHLICWLAVAPVLDVYLMGEPWDKLIAQGLTAAIANAVTTAIVGSLLCVAYAATKTKAGSLTKE